MVSSPTGQGTVKCFVCGGSHFARDCPDKRHPGFHKGGFKGKRSYAAEMDEAAYYHNYYTNKGKSFGKGKSKSKSKKGMFMDAQASWLKGKNKGQDRFPRPVNAYSADVYYHSLEMTSTMEMASATASTSTPERGMIDCGATASAAPEAVVQGLISAILEKDKEARIDIDQSARPYFRFGDGRWGRALYRVRLSSDVSGSRRHFALYALPNPPEYYKANFDKSTLVPILIGMDFLGKDGNGMIIDFTTGMTVSSHDEHPEVVHLNQNHKGHFLLDVVQFLTCGHERSEGHAHVVIMSTDTSLSPSPEVHVLELHPMQFDLAASDVEYEERILECSRQRLLGLHALSRAKLNESAAATSSMCRATSARAISSTPSPTTLLDGGERPSALPPGPGRRAGRDSEHQGADGPEGEGQAVGHL